MVPTFPPARPRGCISSAASGRSACSYHGKSAHVKMGYALHKSFIRPRESPGNSAPTPPAPTGQSPYALTRNRPRVSYLSRHSFGIRPETAPETVQHHVPDLRFAPLKESCVEQEADGSWVTGFDAVAGSLHLPAAPSSPLFQRRGRLSSAPFPETNFFRQAPAAADWPQALSGG